MPYLMMKIEEKRNKMFVLVDKYGVTSKQAIECSQQLDKLLNKFMFDKKKKD